MAQVATNKTRQLPTPKYSKSLPSLQQWKKNIILFVTQINQQIRIFQNRLNIVDNNNSKENPTSEYTIEVKESKGAKNIFIGSENKELGLAKPISLDELTKEFDRYIRKIQDQGKFIDQAFLKERLEILKKKKSFFMT